MAVPYTHDAGWKAFGPNLAMALNPEDLLLPPKRLAALAPPKISVPAAEVRD